MNKQTASRVVRGILATVAIIAVIIVFGDDDGYKLSEFDYWSVKLWMAATAAASIAAIRIINALETTQTKQQTEK